jgi:acetolactate decarboxylase
MVILKKLLLLLFLASSVLPVQAGQILDNKAFQYGTIDGLLAGAYDGEFSVGDLERKGNFGIGTYNRVDGEMILVDGVAYKAKSDGTVVVARQSELTPFAIVTAFSAASRLALTHEMTLKELEDRIDQQLENKNIFYAIRIDGHLKHISTRAISPQNKPYKTLAEVVTTQSVFNYEDANGVLIAFRSPGFSKGFSVPGYHWHFLSDDKQTGGHVLSLTVADSVVQIMPIADIEIKLPTNSQFAITDQTIDRASELKNVESARKQ